MATIENENVLTDLEARFCLLFVNGTPPLAGNVVRCWQAIHPEADDVEATTEGKALLAREVVKKRLAELNAVSLHTAELLRPRITETLLHIMEECAGDTYTDENEHALSPAALRSVSVSAAKELNSMYGIKEAIAHKVSVDCGGSQGVTFNIIAPAKREEVDDKD